ncbi:hypothetical protein PVAP13_1NG193219 [Panicum virgatum]|uniref:Uncharacterized protein n=1 Tax=Panicum virgatum TaxID=38727 RepID=A0A8T0X4Y0_PANVG|nr:hypothetical protein PVAP13_1NG193219 [Panicum virgatum]
MWGLPAAASIWAPPPIHPFIHVGCFASAAPQPLSLPVAATARLPRRYADKPPLSRQLLGHKLGTSPLHTSHSTK